MQTRLPDPGRLARHLVVLALAALVLAAREVQAQGEGDNYRLSLPVLRKALPILYLPEAKTACDQHEAEYRDVRSMTVARMQELLDQCAPLKRAAAAQGLTTHELALVSKALTLAAYRMADEESAKLSDGNAAPLPAGALHDNVALLRANDAELRKLTPQ
jgi:hypothetical protein